MLTDFYAVLIQQCRSLEQACCETRKTDVIARLDDEPERGMLIETPLNQEVRRCRRSSQQAILVLERHCHFGRVTPSDFEAALRLFDEHKKWLDSIDRLVTDFENFATLEVFPTDQWLERSRSVWERVRAEQAVTPYGGSADTSHSGRTNIANIEKLFPMGLEGLNQDIIDLAICLQTEAGEGKSMRQIARDFMKDEGKAESLLTQIRRYRKKGRIVLPDAEAYAVRANT